jgi:hypothetical protein
MSEMTYAQAFGDYRASLELSATVEANREYLGDRYEWARGVMDETIKIGELLCGVIHQREEMESRLETLGKLIEIRERGKNQTQSDKTDGEEYK